MAIKVIAQRRELKIGNKPGKRFIMRPELYSPIQEKKVFAEAATHSGISAGSRILLKKSFAGENADV